MSTTFPGESAEYRAARDRLLEQEIELRRAMEAVAARRRELPPGVGQCRRTMSSKEQVRTAHRPTCGSRRCSRPARARW